MKLILDPEPRQSWIVRQYLPQICVGSALPIAIPIIQFGLVYQWWWGKAREEVDKQSCTCSCWDTAFKGSYESGVGRYKHFYFNTNYNTAVIWTLTVLSIVALYESTKYCCRQVSKGESCNKPKLKET